MLNSRALLTLLALTFASSASALDADAISQIVGVTASTTADGVVRVTWGRTDVDLKVDGVPLEPFAGLTSWAAFTETRRGTMVMGDTVVFQDEANPAMDAAFENGLRVTALHNHFFYDDPPVYFMHIGGEGDSDALAKGVRAMWDAVKAVREKAPVPARRFPGESPSPSTISPEPLTQIIGLQPALKDGMVKFSVGREGAMNGTNVAGSMGLGTWAAFTGNDELAVVGGDFIMTAQEVQPVLRALRKSNINVVTLHNHMIGEVPVFYFVHFWGKGKPTALAQGLKAALDAQKSAGQ